MINGPPFGSPSELRGVWLEQHPSWNRWIGVYYVYDHQNYSCYISYTIQHIYIYIIIYTYTYINIFCSHIFINTWTYRQVISDVHIVTRGVWSVAECWFSSSTREFAPWNLHCTAVQIRPKAYGWLQTARCPWWFRGWTPSLKNVAGSGSFRGCHIFSEFKILKLWIRIDSKTRNIIN